MKPKQVAAAAAGRQSGGSFVTLAELYCAASCLQGHDKCGTVWLSAETFTTSAMGVPHQNPAGRTT
jgi:hypothetical protein